MALDSAAKRASSASFGTDLIPFRIPAATDMDEAGDRANEVFLYFGASEFSSGPGLFGDRRRRAMAVLLRAILIVLPYAGEKLHV